MGSMQSRRATANEKELSAQVWVSVCSVFEVVVRSESAVEERHG